MRPTAPLPTLEADEATHRRERTVYIGDGDEGGWINVVGPNRNVHAEQIVARCNLHTELVAALRSAKVALSFCGKTAQARGLSADARREIDAALAKLAAA